MKVTQDLLAAGRGGEGTAHVCHSVNVKVRRQFITLSSRVVSLLPPQGF